MRSRLKIRQLALIVHLDEQRSVQKAASAAGMTQPAASKLLREIETELGTSLFERHARGVIPTWYGEILVRRARAVLSELSLAQDEVDALQSGLSGQAAIGTILNPGVNLVPAAVGLLKQRHPGLQVSIEVDYSRPLVERLLQGNLDVIVARILDSHGADELCFEPLKDERHSVIAGVQHPLHKRRDVKLEELVDQTWILPPAGSVLRGHLASLFLQSGLSLPANVVQTTSLPVIIALLRTTNMIAPVPDDAMRACFSPPEITMLIEDLGVSMGPFGIITQRRRKLSPGAEFAVATLRELAGIR